MTHHRHHKLQLQIRPVAFVAGSAHFDVIARQADVPTVAFDKPGTVTFTLGGASCNVAVNLAKLGIHCRFFTALPPGVYSDLVLQELQRAGVEPRVVSAPRLPLAMFSAHLDVHGEPVSTITSAPVEDFRFTATEVRTAMNGARLALLDTNLSGEALDLIVGVANDLEIPVFILSAAEVKTPRILQITGDMAGVFLNRDEYRFLVQTKFPGHSRYEDLAAVLNTMVCITRDSDGAALVTAGGTEVVSPPSVPFSGNRMGAGDAFAAGVVYHRVIKAQSWTKAAVASMELVRDVLSRDGCNVAAK